MLPRLGSSRSISSIDSGVLSLRYLVDCPDSKELEGKSLVEQVDALRDAIVLIKIESK